MEGGEAGGGGEAPPPTESGPPAEGPSQRPSQATMKKEAPASAAPPPSKMKAFKENCQGCCHFIYNRDNGTVMGRGCRRWAFLILFYVLFYLTILGFFLAYLGVIMSSIDKNLPTEYWQEKSKRAYWDGSRLQISPAVIFYPTSERQMNPESPLVWITKDNYKNWATKVGEQIKGTEEKLKTAWNKNSFDVPTFPGGVGCDNSDGAYGYSKKQPTFLVRITKMLKWKPKPFASESALEKYIEQEDLKNSFIKAQKDFLKAEFAKDGAKKLLIICEGETVWDSQSIREITYCGGIGVDIENFPYRDGKTYAPPFIAIQFKNAIPGVPIAVECFPLAANIDPLRIKSHGREKFEFMIDL